MKYGVSYNRKVKAGKAYEMLEIGFWHEADDATQTPQSLYEHLKKTVNKWIDEERERLLEKSVPRPSEE